ncbi:MAG: helix-turn-helix domain-containing protein [Roseburia sp.]|nr:helix-turn-helix domain-containing protein [Roseburia sp.]
MEFGKRLKELLKDKGISQETLAKNIGVSQRAVSKWINNQSEPTLNSIINCAVFFEVSADYLLGLKDE